MKPHYHKQVKDFLQSTEATASAFSSIGWDMSRERGERNFWCVVNYGILEEMELDIVLQGDGGWFAELYVPPILECYEQEATDLCDRLCKAYPPLVATVDTDRSVLLAAIGTGDPMPTIREWWKVFGQDEVYQAVLYLAGLTAPTEEDAIPLDCPDPFDDEE